MKTSNRKLTYTLVLIFIAIGFYPLFAFLGSLPLRLWDESRLAASAYEMISSDNPLITTFYGMADHWNVKPPLLIWIQALSIKLFGLSEASVRLPSALSIMILGIFIIIISSKLNKTYLGFYTSLVIISTKGLLEYHCGRNADYDAMLIMFMVVYSLYYFLFLEKKKIKYLYLFFIFLILATFTKGIQAIIPIPFLFIYTLFTKNTSRVLKNKNTYIGIGLFILIIGGYYFLREIYDNGYLKAVIENELGGRYFNTIENHNRENNFYFFKLKNNLFSYFFILSLVSFLINLFNRDKVIRRLNIYSFGIALFIFIIISLGKTKLFWYSLPIIPFLSINIGCLFYSIHRLIINNIKNKNLSYSIIIIACLAVFYIPYKENINMVTMPKEKQWDRAYYSRDNIIRQVIKGHISYDKPFTFIYTDNYQDHVFYRYKMIENGIPARTIWIKHIQKGDIILINNKKTEEEISKKFNYEVVYQDIQSRVINIKNSRN